jgi:hypothetical protein
MHAMIVAGGTGDRRRAMSTRGRRGISLIETQIAFVVLGIGLAGLCPIVTKQYRQLANLEGNIHPPDEQHPTHYLSPTTPNEQPGRLQAYSYSYNSPGMARTEVTSGQLHYVIPWDTPWARKLTARAQVEPGPRSPGDPPEGTPSSLHVELIRLERMKDGQGRLVGWRAVVNVE